MSETVLLVAMFCVTLSAFAGILGVVAVTWKILGGAGSRTESEKEAGLLTSQEAPEESRLSYGLPEYSEEVGYTEES